MSLRLDVQLHRPAQAYLDDLRGIFSAANQLGPVTADTDTHENITSLQELAEL